LDGDALADAEASDIGTDCFDPARGLVARHDWATSRGEIPRNKLEIRRAETHGFDTDKDVAGAWLRRLAINDFESVRALPLDRSGHLAQCH
jgi:hypothetical protein